MEWSSQLVLRTNKHGIALLAVKCLNEIQDPNITKDAASLLDITENGKLDLSSLYITPVDCKGLLDFLFHVNNLEELNISDNEITDHAVPELCKFLINSGLGVLDISGNFLSDKGFEMLGDTLSEGTCKLHYLEIGKNFRASYTGYGKLYDALRKGGFALSSVGWTSSIVEFAMEISPLIPNVDDSATLFEIIGTLPEPPFIE